MCRVLDILLLQKSNPTTMTTIMPRRREDMSGAKTSKVAGATAIATVAMVTTVAMATTIARVA